MIHSLTIMKNSAKSIWIDRGMFLSDLVIATIVPFLTQALIWNYIYSSANTPINEFKFYELMFYYIYAILFGRFNNCYDLIVNFSQAIQEGTVETYFLKPMNITMFELQKFIGGGFIYSIPIILAAIAWTAFSHFADAPQTTTSILHVMLYYTGVGVFIGLSQILCFYIGWSVAQLCFWFVRSDFLANITVMASAFLGGELLPSTFWPPLLRPLLTYNPFSILIARPSELLIHVDFQYLVDSFILCTLYIFVFLGLSKVLFHFGRRRYESVGG